MSFLLNCLPFMGHYLSISTFCIHLKLHNALFNVVNHIWKERRKEYDQLLTDLNYTE